MSEERLQTLPQLGVALKELLYTRIYELAVPVSGLAVTGGVLWIADRILEITLNVGSPFDSALRVLLVVLGLLHFIINQLQLVDWLAKRLHRAPGKSAPAKEDHQ